MFLKKLLYSFGYALEGIVCFFKTERNALIHLCALIMVVILGFVLSLNKTDWLWILLAIALVIISEMANTAIEKICDKISPERDADIKVIKDISAGFVLVAAIFALLVGAIIFTPYLLL